MASIRSGGARPPPPSGAGAFEASHDIAGGSRGEGPAGSLSRRLLGTGREQDERLGALVPRAPGGLRELPVLLGLRGGERLDDHRLEFAGDLLLPLLVVPERLRIELVEPPRHLLQ